MTEVAPELKPTADPVALLRDAAGLAVEAEAQVDELAATVERERDERAA